MYLDYQNVVKDCKEYGISQNPCSDSFKIWFFSAISEEVCCHRHSPSFSCEGLWPLLSVMADTDVVALLS